MARDLISSQADLLRRPGSVIPVEGAIKVGGIYAVLDSRDRRPMYYRCRVISHKNYNQTYDVGQLTKMLNNYKTFNRV